MPTFGNSTFFWLHPTHAQLLASLIPFDLCVCSGSAAPLGLRSAVSAEEVSRRETRICCACCRFFSLSLSALTSAVTARAGGRKLAPFLAGCTGVSRERRKRKRSFRDMCLVEMCLIEMCLGHSLRLWCRLWRKPCLERKSISTSAWMGWGFGWVLVGC